jgi:hypothetical protein
VLPPTLHCFTFPSNHCSSPSYRDSIRGLCVGTELALLRQARGEGWGPHSARRSSARPGPFHMLVVVPNCVFLPMLPYPVPVGARSSSAVTGSQTHGGERQAGRGRASGRESRSRGRTNVAQKAACDEDGGLQSALQPSQALETGPWGKGETVSRRVSRATLARGPPCSRGCGCQGGREQVLGLCVHAKLSSRIIAAKVVQCISYGELRSWPRGKHITFPSPALPFCRGIG